MWLSWRPSLNSEAFTITTRKRVKVTPETRCGHPQKLITRTLNATLLGKHYVKSPQTGNTPWRATLPQTRCLLSPETIYGHDVWQSMFIKPSMFNSHLMCKLQREIVAPIHYLWVVIVSLRKTAKIKTREAKNTRTYLGDSAGSSFLGGPPLPSPFPEPGEICSKLMYNPQLLRFLRYR